MTLSSHTVPARRPAGVRGILAPADRHYVVIEDLLPAGLEPIDTRLQTVDPAL